MLERLARYVGVSGITLAVAGITLSWILFNYRKTDFRSDHQQKEQNGSAVNIPVKETTRKRQKKNIRKKLSKIRIFYATQTGTAKSLCDVLASESSERNIAVEITDLKEYDPEDVFGSEVDDATTHVFIVSTYTAGTPPEDCKWFFSWLEEAASDFRVSKKLLEKLNFCVVGLGNSLYKDSYCVAGKNLDSWLSELGGIRLMSLFCVDENVSESKRGGLEKDFDFWKNNFWTNMQRGFNLNNAKDKHEPCKDSKDGNCACKKKTKRYTKQENTKQENTKQEFKVNGEWWTWIDYDRFHHLNNEYMSSDGRLAFSANDYMAKTPDWAVFGAKEQGFDPAEERFYRKKKNDGSGDADDCD